MMPSGRGLRQEVARQQDLSSAHAGHLQYFAKTYVSVCTRGARFGGSEIFSAVACRDAALVREVTGPSVPQAQVYLLGHNPIGVVKNPIGVGTHGDKKMCSPVYSHAGSCPACSFHYLAPLIF